VPEKGENGDDWTVVRVRRRKASGQVELRRDGQREFKRQGGSEARQDQRFRAQNYQQHVSRVCNDNMVVSQQITVRAQVQHQTRPSAIKQAGGTSKQNTITEGDVIMGSDLKRYVTFYFTNVPNMLPYHYAKEGFEVCEILDNLFLSRKRNRQGYAYGFVRYLNVRECRQIVKGSEQRLFRSVSCLGKSGSF